MKKQTILIPFTFLLFAFLLVLGFSNAIAEPKVDTLTYLPITMDFSDQLLRDTFSDPTSGWPIDDDGNTRWSYQDGEYEMLIREARWRSGALAKPIELPESYSVEASMRRTQGTENDYGLIFDYMDWDNYYYLIVGAGTRWFGVAKVVDGTHTIVIPRTIVENVINPDNSTNHLRVERKGDQIEVIINDETVSPTDPPVTSSGFDAPPRVGFYMESDGDSPAAVRFDDFEVWRLDNDTIQKMKQQPVESSAGEENMHSESQLLDFELFD
jgi:hypothetical protein